MKKAILSFIVVAAVGGTTTAQISDRANNAQTFKTDARPVAGTMALTFGTYLVNETETPGMNMLQNGNLINVKKFNTDDVAYRGGIRLAKASSSESGDFDQSTGNPNGTNSTFNNNVSTREYLLVPGIEKHFLSSNFFDVYAGADVYLGSNRTVDNQQNEQTNGDFSKVKTTTNGSTFGLGAVTGVNIFVANLPLSIGVEYGITGLWRGGIGKSHTVSETRAGGTTTTQDFYELESQPGSTFTKAKSTDFNLDNNQQVRVVLNIYFN